ncbi:hypothetical protein JCM10908_003194 [Rhodotorula pacifica]|uniref:uncharacterized protein n=1 Tax=Rhodotorula pacifica TaxID=1495444 RepID=UPI00317E82B0
MVTKREKRWSAQRQPPPPQDENSFAPLTASSASAQQRLSKPAHKHILRSSSMPIHLSLKPLPIAVEDEKARLAAWNWGDTTNDGGGRNAYADSPNFHRHNDEHQRGTESNRVQASARSALPPLLPAKERPLSTITASDMTASRRTSAVSDGSAERIAFAEPVLHNPPPLLPPFALEPSDFSLGLNAPDQQQQPLHSAGRRNRSLSPIYESPSSVCLSSAACSAIDFPLSAAAPVDEAAISLQAVPTARPILHVDAASACALRKASAYSASVYSTNEQEPHSYFSPDSAPHEKELEDLPQLDGLAISGVGVDAYNISPSAPASPRYVARTSSAADQRPALPLAPISYSTALTNKPSFSAFRFPSPSVSASVSASPSPSPASSESGKAASSLFDQPEQGLTASDESNASAGGGAPSSTLTAATSMFDSPYLLSSELKSSTSSSVGLAATTALQPNTGSSLWRNGWSLEAPQPVVSRASNPAVIAVSAGEVDKPELVERAVPAQESGTSRSGSPSGSDVGGSGQQGPEEPEQTAPLPAAVARSRPVSISPDGSKPARQSRPVSFAFPSETSARTSVEEVSPPLAAAGAAAATARTAPQEGPSASARNSKVFEFGNSTLSIHRKKSKLLPAIPDSASIWSGEDRIEVYCQRELVRHHRGRTERIILERTLLYDEGEGASRDAVGVAV